MFHIPQIKSDLENRISCFLSRFKLDIIKYSNAQWNEEDIVGTTNIKWKLAQYYNLLQLLILIYLDIKRLGDLKDWSYYETKYDINKHRECLACIGISLDEAMKCFDIPLQAEPQGIEGLGIEINYEIEPENLIGIQEIEIIDLKYLLANPISCTNFIQTNCN